MLADVLGLDRDETAAYRELITLPSATAEEIAAALAMTSADARHALIGLEHHGLAARTGGDMARFVAAPPAIALGALVAARQNEIRLAEVELSTLDDLYRQASTQRGRTDVVDVVQGRDAIRQRFEQLQLGARKEVLAFVKPPVVAMQSDENTAEDEAVARGVDYRIVLERSMLTEGVNTYDQLIRAAESGEEIRVADRVPLKLVIIDRELAYLPIASEPGDVADGALLVHESGLLDALVALFEVSWRQASPIAIAASGVKAPQVDDLDARVLTLLLAGLTDQAVATHLSTSLRTVQRRVRHLMNIAGVETRMQLGWHAARHGWV